LYYLFVKVRSSAMRRKFLSLALVLVLLFALCVPAFAASGSSFCSGCAVFKSVGNLVAKAAFRVLFGSNDFYNNQWQTARSVSRLNSDLYLLNYQYDYDIDDLLARGTSSTADLLLYCSQHLLYGKVPLKLNLKGFGCSAFTAVTPQGEPIMGRNFDYYDAPGLVVWTDPADGYASVSMVDANMILCGNLNAPSYINNSFQLLLAPYLPMDGINEKGLSIAVLEVLADKTSQSTGKTDIVTTVAIRAVLDKCANVNEAIKLFSSFDMNDLLIGCSYHYLLSDSDGNSCVIEYINNEMRVIRPQKLSNGKSVSAATNFFLSEDGVEDSAAGMLRYDTMTEALARKGGVISEIDALKLLNTVHLDYWSTVSYIRTLWSESLNNRQKTMTLCAGLDYSTIYRFSPTNPGVATAVSGNANISNYVDMPD